MTRRIAGTTLAFLVLLLATGTVQLWGQAVASAQISGLVADPSGAAVPSAKITATQTETGLVRTTLSGRDGTYVLPGLPVGPYKLEVQVSGFETYVQTGIHLEVSNNVTINRELLLVKRAEKRRKRENTSSVSRRVMVKARGLSLNIEEST